MGCAALLLRGDSTGGEFRVASRLTTIDRNPEHRYL